MRCFSIAATVARRSPRWPVPVLQSFGLNAIDITNKAQSDMGGWYYTPDKGNDEGSTTIPVKPFSPEPGNPPVGSKLRSPLA